MINIINVANSIARMLDTENTCFGIDRIDIQFNKLLSQYVAYVDFRNVMDDDSPSPKFVIYDDGSFNKLK